MVGDDSKTRRGITKAAEEVLRLTQSITTSDWMEVLRDTMNEVATTALGLPECEITKVTSTTPEGLNGAYLALVGQEDSIQIGLASSAEGCQAL